MELKDSHSLNGSDRPIFVTMGMLIIDEIHFPQNHDPKKSSVYDILGGAGTYGVIGARLFCGPPPLSHEVGWIADKGKDFPESIEKEINSWQTGTIWRYNPTRLTTRGWNSYGANDERAFKYTSPKLRIEAHDLKSFRLDKSKSIHFICSPKRYLEFMNQLRPDGVEWPESAYIWEPVPDECKPETLPVMQEALQKVDVLTPNAKEAAMFFAEDEPLLKPEIEKLAAKLVPFLRISRCKSLVMRCGALGCLAVQVTNTEDHFKWCPAYHNPGNPDFKLEDPTGGGNTFVGGFAAGLVLSSGDIQTACIYGNVAASLAIEQIGLPVLGQSNGQETWNGRPISDRIDLYCKRNNFSAPLSEADHHR